VDSRIASSNDDAEEVVGWSSRLTSSDLEMVMDGAMLK